MSQALIVTNDSDLTKSLLGIFRQMGVSATICPTLRDAKMEARSFPKPNLLILDWTVQENGVTNFLVDLKNDPDFTSLPVLMITDFPDPATIKRAMQAGASRYITKMFVNHNLKSTVQGMLAPV